MVFISSSLVIFPKINFFTNRSDVAVKISPDKSGSISLILLLRLYDVVVMKFLFGRMI